MDYEIKYKEALERARQFSEHPLLENSSNIVEYIFPKLGVSEDEQILKEIAEFIYNSAFKLKDIKKKEKWLTWLEKQDKTQGKLALEDIKEEKVDNANKVEPKFKNGQWIVWQDKCYKVNDNGCGYELIDQNDLSTSLEYGTVDESAHLWTIQDAKDGDVLVDVYGNIGIFQKNDDFDWTSYCSLGVNGGFQNFKVEHENDKTQPATKEQRDLLFQKMKENGYILDVEKKNLSKCVIDEGKSEIDYCFTKMMNGEKVNPAWSDEDEKMCNDIIRDITIDKSMCKYEVSIAICDEKIEWLKQIKYRIRG